MGMDRGRLGASWCRLLTALAVALLAGPVASAYGHHPAHSSAQEDYSRSEREAAGPPGGEFRHVPGLGPTRRDGRGGLQVRLPDGTIVPTHGMDVAPKDAQAPPPEQVETTAPDRNDGGDVPVGRAAGNNNTSYPSFSNLVNPSCYAGEGRVELVYTHASDISDGWSSSNNDEMRGVLKKINTWLREQALNDSNGNTAARLRAVCYSSGTLFVSDAGQSAHSASGANYDDVVAELRGKGYNNPDKKYLVLFDTGDCKPTGVPNQCATGVGTWWNDATRSTTNPANQPYSNSFAGISIVWGPRYFHEFGTATLHELMHSMGAVNTAAPYNTGAGHCWDDLDTMCYDDGGSNPPGAVFSRCSLSSIDCYSDAYYRVGASSGWVSSNWQVGYTGNRFMSFG